MDTIKLFLSYSHNDETYVNEFIKFTNPLHSGEKRLFELWYDREMYSGSYIWDEIDRKINESDGAIMFLSPDYLSSKSCIKEMKRFIELHNKNGFLLLPLVLKVCLWQEYDDLKSILSLTTDAAPLSKFKTTEEGLANVVSNIRKSIENHRSLIDVPNETIRVYENETVECSITIKFNINDANKKTIMDLLSQMGITIYKVNTRHFDGDISTNNSAYQIRNTPDRMLTVLQQIYDGIGYTALTQITYISTNDGFERESLTLLQAIKLIKHKL